MTERQDRSKMFAGALSRRDVLRGGSLLLPASAIVPGFFTGIARAQTASTFDYYISVSGNDSNPGTLASPWAITAINTKQSIYAGKRVGIVAGSYDISSLMGTYHSPALQINGGPNSSTLTYIGSCNSTGAYALGVATLDAKGASGLYGGGNSNISTMIGTSTQQGGGGPQPANWGNWILDGLRLINFSMWALQVGSYDGSGGAVPNTTIQNCEFTGENAGSAPVGGVQVGALEPYHYTNCLVSNCYIHDNISPGNSGPHFAAITVWGGVSGGPSSGLTIQNCTLVNTGAIYGIYDTGVIYGTTIQQCFIDMTQQNAPGATNEAIQGFGNSGSSGDAGSVFRNNIFRGGYPIDTQGESPQEQWASTAACYNNTWDLAGGTGQNGGSGFRFLEASGHIGIFSFYNNLCWDNGATGISGGYGYNAGNVDGFAVCDYNIYGTINQFTTYASGSSGTHTSQSFSGWKTAIGGLEAHSTTNSANPFTNKGAFALAYSVQSGSPAYQSGRVGGVATGAVCNVGAWDGTVTQIGCNFAAGIVAPNPAVLSVS